MDDELRKLDASLTGRCYHSRKIGNNTYLVRFGDDEIGVRLHSTHVLIFNLSKGTVTLYSGGWYTVTTKDRMNMYLRKWGIRVSQRKHMWYVHTRAGVVEYQDGMQILLCGRNI